MAIDKAKVKEILLNLRGKKDKEKTNLRKEFRKLHRYFLGQSLTLSKERRLTEALRLFYSGQYADAVRLMKKLR